MRKLELSIDRLDANIRVWFKKHVKWLKNVICCINGEFYVDEESGLDGTLMYVIAETYDKRNPYVFYETFWVDGQIVGHRKSSPSAFSERLIHYHNHLIVPSYSLQRTIKLICGLILANSTSINVTVNNKQITF